jgi:hypothetical protein
MVDSTRADSLEKLRQAVSTKKQPGYGIFLGLTVTSVLAAMLTLLPLPASKPNVIGFVSHCTWAPWSTLILLVAAGAFCKVRVRQFKTRALDGQGTTPAAREASERPSPPT